MSGRQTPRLGRGLAALIPDRPAQAGGGLRAIPADMLEPSPFQARRAIDEVALKELSDSIRANGLLQPLLARPHPSLPGRFQIIAGERRWRAAQAAGLHEVPALIRPMSDPEAMAAGLVENLQRADLNGIEEAEGYRRLTDEFGMTQEALAEAVGKSRSHVGNMMRLLQLPEPVRRLVSEGRLSAGHARALINHPDPEAAAASILANGLSVRAAELFGRQPPPQPDRACERAAPSPEASDLERRLSSHLGLRVSVTWNGRRGRIAIDVDTLDQMDGVVRLLQEPA